jgi:hypothetical protein
MIKPFLVIIYFAFEPFWKLSQMINKLSVEVLNAPLNLAFVLRIRRMRKMRHNTMQNAPALPLLLKLRSMIRQNTLRKPLLLLQNSHRFSRSQLMIKLLCCNNEPTVVVDANKKPVPLALNVKRPLKSICQSSSGACALKNFQRLYLC